MRKISVFSGFAKILESEAKEKSSGSWRDFEKEAEPKETKTNKTTAKMPKKEHGSFRGRAFIESEGKKEDKFLFATLKNLLYGGSIYLFPNLLFFSRKSRSFPTPKNFYVRIA